jgi:NADH:ubiquinone oxidoreductase subunit K
MTISPLHLGVGVALALLGVGLYGLMTQRNLIRLIIALQVISKGVVVLVVMAGVWNGRINLAQSVAATFIVADTVVAVVGLALAVQLHRCYGTLDLHVSKAERKEPSA